MSGGFFLLLVFVAFEPKHVLVCMCDGGGEGSEVLLGDRGKRHRLFGYYRNCIAIKEGHDYFID